MSITQNAVIGGVNFNEPVRASSYVPPTLADKRADLVVSLKLNRDACLGKSSELPKPKLFRHVADRVQVVLKYGNSNMTNAVTCANNNTEIETLFNSLIAGVEAHDADALIQEHMQKQKSLAAKRFRSKAA